MFGYVSFACLFMVLFGIVFQLPLVMLVLSKMGIVKGSQLAANRKNAQKSTGPKTPDGKSIVAQNATTHGLRASRVLIASEDSAEFDTHRNTLLEDLAPVGPMETIFAILERLMMYERRIENSLYKTHSELQRLQLLRHKREQQTETSGLKPQV